VSLSTWAAVFLAVFTSGACADPHGLTPYPNPERPADFSLQDTNGRAHALSDYRGKVIIVNFWATWCPPCVKEMPSLQRLGEQLDPETSQILAINMGERREEIESFAKQYALNFPLLVDPEMAVATAWSVKGLPTTYILDPTGTIVLWAIGDLNWDEPSVLRQLQNLRKTP
jgi:peroxiredoxin